MVLVVIEIMMKMVDNEQADLAAIVVVVVVLLTEEVNFT
jgi:hypothetical protein